MTPTRNELITLKRQLISTQKTCTRMLPIINGMLASTPPTTKRVGAVKTDPKRPLPNSTD